MNSYLVMSLVLDFFKRQLDAEQIILDKLNEDRKKYKNFTDGIIMMAADIGEDDDHIVPIPPIEFHEIFDDLSFELRLDRTKCLESWQ